MRSNNEELVRQTCSLRRIRPWDLVLLLSMLFISPSLTEAKNLNDVIPDLYGGDGLQTDPTVSGNRSEQVGNAVFNSFNELTNGIGAQTGQFAVNLTVAAYRFDVERGVPVEVTKSLGPLLENVPTRSAAGKGRFDSRSSGRTPTTKNSMDRACLRSTRLLRLPGGPVYP